jgi:iron complex outermembrane recepter protein
MHAYRVVIGVSAVVLSSAFFFATPRQAHAQSQTTAGGSQDTSGGLEEITVTARRKEENLQSVPVAVTALSGDQIDMRAMADIRDVGRFTPNVYMSAAGASSPEQLAIFIRGIGISDQNALIDPAIGVYVDGVYMARSQAGVMDLLDIDRIEVLRGPQGTLFGQNTSGGVVNVVSRVPDPNGGGSVSVTGGNIGRVEASARADVSIAENLTLGISGMAKHRDCLATRIDDQACYGDIEHLGGRVYLHWTPTTDFTADLIGDTQVGRSHAVPMQAVGYDPSSGIFATYNGLCAQGLIPGCRPYTLTNPGVAPNPYSVSPNGMTTYVPSNNSGASLQLAWTVGDVTLHSITAYRKVNAISATDLLGSPNASSYSPVPVWENAGSHLTTEEFRADGAALGDRLHYLGGLYFYDEDAFQRTAVGTFAPLEAGNLNVNEQTTKSEAVFLHLKYDITSRFHATAGIRKSWTKKDFEYKFSNYSAILDYTGIDPNTQPAQLIYTYGNNLPNALLGNSTDFVRRTASWGPVTPQGGIDFQLTPDILLFADVARGFRSGGFNPRATSLAGTAPYAPEYTTSYELGIKSEFFDHRLRMNATIFYTKYTNLQESILSCERDASGGCALDPNGAPIQDHLITNAAAAKIDGGEFEFAAILGGGFRLDGSAGYTNPKFISVAAAATAATGLSVNSAWVQVPKFTSDLAAQHELNTPRGTVTSRVDWTYRSTVDFTINRDPYNIQPGFGLVNATVTFKDSAERWKTTAYIRNAANKRYLLSTLGFPEIFGASGALQDYGDPREFGLTVSRLFR